MDTVYTPARAHMRWGYAHECPRCGNDQADWAHLWTVVRKPVGPTVSVRYRIAYDTPATFQPDGSRRCPTAPPPSRPTDRPTDGSQTHLTDWPIDRPTVPHHLSHPLRSGPPLELFPQMHRRHAADMRSGTALGAVFSSKRPMSPHCPRVKGGGALGKRQLPGFARE